MTLPTSGPLSFLMIRNDARSLDPGAFPDGSVTLPHGVRSYFVTEPNIHGRDPFYISMSELYGRTYFYIGKLSAAALSGYWVEDILLPETTYHDTLISEEEYQLLYEDGLMDLPPAEFFAQQKAVAPVVETDSVDVGTATVLGEYRINSVCERFIDTFVTEGVFEVSVCGHDVPEDWFSEIHVLAADGELVRVFVRGRAERLTSAKGNRYTYWSWPVARGEVFPEGEDRFILFK